jgi:DNA-binding SARP family transcriptional activator/DNA-binding NarL/FixJ family response regulator
MNSKVTYRQQFTRCGKERCRKCREGEGHGPYWYAYWSEKGRTISKYIGTHLPVGIVPVQTQSVLVANEEQTPHNCETSSLPILRIYLLGQFKVEHQIDGEWQVIDNRKWHRRRVRALLGCLLSSPGRRLGREQVMDSLWPDLEVEIASNRLNGAVHELRQILEPNIARPAASQLLRLERDVLQLADQHSLWVDADAFEALLKEAYATDDMVEAEHLMEQAEALYKGSYLLEELYSEWATRRRDVLQRRWIGLLLNMARLRAQRGALSSAVELLDRLRTAEPTNETALQHLMIVLTHMDRRGEAIQTYRQYAEMLKREYESEPLLETRSLYEMLRQGHIPHMPQPDMARPGTTPGKEPNGKTGKAGSTNSAPLIDPKKAFPRPSFHISRHNRRPLVDRERERDTIRQIMLHVEGQSHKRDLQSEKPQTASRSNGHNTTGQFSHFILLQGEAGIGKTRLAEELSLEADKRNWAIAWSRAYEQEGTIPYRPWTELLRALLSTLIMPDDKKITGVPPFIHELAQRFHFRPERLGSLLPEWATSPQAVASHALPAMPHEQERLLLWESTLGLLNALSTIHPLLLVLDDLHWADESSIELLSYLTHHIHHQRILLIGTNRDKELAPTHKLRALVADLHREQKIVILNIEPLTQSQMGVLLSHLPQNLVQYIQMQAAGNPFFAEELARAVETNTTETCKAHPPLSPQEQTEQEGYSARQAPHRYRSLPEAIATVLDRRLNRLSSECQTLLSKAAILGGSFELNQLLPMAQEHSEDRVLDLLDEALNAGLLAEISSATDITYQFWHPLIVSHLYDRLSAARRALLHRKAAEAIKIAQSSQPQEKVAATIIYHLRRGHGDTHSIAHYAELAGNNAYTIAAYSEARYYYLLALHAQLGTPLHTIDRIASHTSIDLITSQPITAHLFSTIKEPHHFCRLLEFVAECCNILGDFEDARHLYEHMLCIRTSEYFQQHIATDHKDMEFQQKQEAQIQGLLWRAIGNTWKNTGEYEKAFACYQRGKDIMIKAGVTSGVAWACLHLQYSALLRLKGNTEEALEYLQASLQILEQVIASNPLTLTTINKALTTRTERALIGDPIELGNANELLGILETSTGQLTDALKRMRTALDIFERHERFSDIARTCGNLGAAYIMKGDLDSARIYLKRSYDMAERIGDLPNIAFVTINLGDVFNRSGNLLEAENWLRRSLSIAERVNDREHMSWCYSELARVQQDLGQLQDAAQSLYHAMRIGRAIKNIRCIHYAMICLGNLRTTSALLAHQIQSNEAAQPQRSPLCKLLLARARATLRHALHPVGLEAEVVIEGKLYLATVHFIDGDLATATEMAQHCLQEAREHETARIEGRTQRLLGCIKARQGLYQEAYTHFEQALAIFRESGMRIDYARVLYGYGTALLQSAISVSSQQDPEYQRGLDYLTEAGSIFTTSNASIDLLWLDKALATYAPHMVVS